MNQEKIQTLVVLASGNEGKVRELIRLFDEPRLHLVSMKALVPSDFQVEESGEHFEDNAWLKALAVCRETGRASLADDSGLEVDALGGRPGVRSARYAGLDASDEENNRLLLRELSAFPPSKRSARFRCVLALAVPGGGGSAHKLFCATGVMEGHIELKSRGGNGFGYDPVFVAEGAAGRSNAELSSEEKDALSHRAAAARELRSRLIGWVEASQSTFDPSL